MFFWWSRGGPFRAARRRRHNFKNLTAPQVPRGSRFWVRPALSFQVRELAGSRSFGACANVSRAGAAEGRWRRWRATHSQLASLPARPGQPERPDSRVEPAKQGKPGQPAGPPRQPGRADRHLEFGEHGFAGRKSTRRRCRRSGQKPARGQRHRLDFCPSLGVAVLSSPPENRILQIPNGPGANRDVSDGGANGAVLHLSHRAPIVL